MRRTLPIVSRIIDVRQVRLTHVPYRPEYSVPPRRPDTPKLPVTTERHGEHLLGLRWLGPAVLTDWGLSGDTPLGQPVEALDLDGDQVAQQGGYCAPESSCYPHKRQEHRLAS